jgi:uncharacterized protein (DUF433 family)
MEAAAIIDIRPTLEAVVPPISVDGQGTARIGATHVTLDTFINAFNSGCDAEDLVLKFPTINLPEAYAAIGYYLSHKATVDGYMARRSENADVNLERVRRDFGSSDLRSRLIGLRGVS